MSTYKGLTLREIIECLTDKNNEVDSKLLNIFLYTYRSYCEPWDIIELIQQRLNHLNRQGNTSESNSTGNNGFVNAIIILFNSWLTVPFAYDFYELPDFRSLNYLLKNIREWPSTISFIKSSIEFKNCFERLKETIGKVLISFNVMDTGPRSDYRELPVDCQFKDSFSFINSLKDDLNKNFFDFTPETIALGLSYLDQKVLQRLRLQELVKHTQKQLAPSVTDVINTYNHLHNVVKLTLKEPNFAQKRFEQYQYSGRNSPVLFDNNSPHESRFVFASSGIKHDQRHQIIEKWIYVAQILHHLRNFSSLVAILTALNSTELKNCMSVLKIKKSIKLSNLYQWLLKVIEPYISQNKEEVLNGNNASVNSCPTGFNYFSRNKNKIKNLRYHPSEIPYLGIYLRNLTYINEGFPDFVNSSLKINNGTTERAINIDKCRRQFDVMAQVRLFIASLNFNDIKEDESFSNWYFYIQTEVRKSKRYTSDANLPSPTLSLDSLKSFNSIDSANSIDHSTPSISRSDSKSYMCMSQDCLNINNNNNNRHRLQSSRSKISQPTLSRNRSVGANLSLHSNDPKVATVKLRETKFTPAKTNAIYQSNYFPGSRPTKPIRKHETISNGASRFHERQLLSNIARSSSSIDKNNERISVNLESILYKKIQIYENDRTTDFIERVLKKFGKPNLIPSDFDVVQILENGREILITLKAHLFYALAEKTEYLIEVRPKELTV